MDYSLESLLEKYPHAPSIEHAGPYADLKVPQSDGPESVAIRDVFTKPFYMVNFLNTEAFAAQYATIRQQVNDQTISNMLVSWNWRPRKVAGLFTAIENRVEFTEHVGRLLLRSDLVYAGDSYALALAIFNTETSVEFLRKYLSHYLTRKDLQFDQSTVIGAIGYCDWVNKTNYLEDHRDAWDDFCDGRKEALADSVQRFMASANAIKSIAKILQKPTEH